MSWSYTPYMFKFYEVYSYKWWFELVCAIYFNSQLSLEQFQDFDYQILMAYPFLVDKVDSGKCWCLWNEMKPVFFSNVSKKNLHVKVVIKFRHHANSCRINSQEDPFHFAYSLPQNHAASGVLLFIFHAFHRLESSILTFYTYR